MEHSFVVLRRVSPIVPDANELGARSRAFGLSMDSLSVDETTLGQSERDDLARDPRTMALAPVMPVTLIAPVDSTDERDAETNSSSGLAWGIEAVRAHASPYDGRGVTVAVLDTGIDSGHPAFQGIEFIKKSFTNDSDATDTNGHGTHVAGTIFGRAVEGKRIGVAPGVSRVVIGKVLGQGGGSSGMIANAIFWAVQQNAHVISMSLGIDFPGYVESLVEQQDLEIAAATSKALEAYRANVGLFRELATYVLAQGVVAQSGTVIVAASGNESRRPRYDIAAAPPASAAGIVAVGAVERRSAGLRVAAFSNSQVNVVAPGVDIESARVGGGLVSMNGTSMATPHVGGVAALHAQYLLENMGRVEGQALQARLVAGASLSPLAADSTAFSDVGSGVVQAPSV